MSGIAPLCFKKSAGISGADRRPGGREIPRRRLRPGGGPPGPLRRRPGAGDRPSRGGGVRRRGGGRADGPGPVLSHRRGGPGARLPLLRVPQHRHRLPPVGAQAAGPAVEAPPGGAPLPGGHGGGPPAAHPAAPGAGLRLHGAGAGAAGRPEPAHRGPRRRRLRPLRPGGGGGPVRPAGRNSGRVLPRHGRPCPGGVLGGRAGHHGDL